MTGQTPLALTASAGLVAATAAAWVALRLLSPRQRQTRIAVRTVPPRGSATTSTTVPGLALVRVGAHTAWVCPSRWPDSLDVAAIDTAIHCRLTHDAHIVYVVRDSDARWPASLASAVRRHQLLCPLPPQPRGPID